MNTGTYLNYVQVIPSYNVFAYVSDLTLDRVPSVIRLYVCTGTYLKFVMYLCVRGRYSIRGFVDIDTIKISRWLKYSDARKILVISLNRTLNAYVRTRFVRDFP